MLGRRETIAGDGLPPAEDRRWPAWRLYCLAGALLAASFTAMLLADVTVSRTLVYHRALQFCHRTLEMAAPYGDASGVILVAMVIYLLDPDRRRKTLRLLVAGLGAGLAADIPKLLVGRIRPANIDFTQLEHVTETFTTWLPLMEGGSKHQSFPSAHTASAVALAIALALTYPRGRQLFLYMAFLVALQRVETGAHYLSDVLAGASVGVMFATLCTRNSAIARWFDRYEAQTPAATEAERETIRLAA